MMTWVRHAQGKVTQRRAQHCKCSSGSHWCQSFKFCRMRCMLMLLPAAELVCHWRDASIGQARQEWRLSLKIQRCYRTGHLQW